MTVGRALLAALFIGAGAMHFVATPVYARIMPPYLPDPVLLVRVSGLCEALGGLGLLFEPTRRVAAWGSGCAVANCGISGECADDRRSCCEVARDSVVGSLGSAAAAGAGDLVVLDLHAGLTWNVCS